MADDWRNDRIQKFTGDGQFLMAFGSSGSDEGEFNRPSGVAVDRDGIIYVADWLNNRLQVFDVDGTFVTARSGDATVSKWGQAKLDANISLAKANAARVEQIQARGTVADILIDQNRPERVSEDQKFYYDLLSFGDTQQQPGADLNAMWYLRNAKIFAKLMTVAEPGDRILVLYGAGHNYWLRHFASTAYGYRNVDPTPYLRKAAKRR